MILVIALVAAQAAAAEAPSAGDPNEVICRSMPTIGSRLARQRRCATRAEWEEIARNDRRDTEDGQLGQVNPQGMTPGNRADAAGRYIPTVARGNVPN